MRTSLLACVRKRTNSHITLCLVIVFLILFMAGCVSAPKSSIPLADISLTNNHLIIQNETGFVWHDAKITIDHKYTYTAPMMTSGKSSVPLAKFIDEQGNSYKRGRWSIRNLTIDVTDTLGVKRHLHW